MCYNNPDLKSRNLSDAKGGTAVKLSTRGRYGIHAMYDLAAHAGDGPVPIKAISERQAVPEAYLEQLMAVLKRAGLVKSTRGAQGGYALSRPSGRWRAASTWWTASRRRTPAARRARARRASCTKSCGTA